MKVEFQEYVYECGDGCCTEWGTNLYIDDKFVGSFNGSEELTRLILQNVLPDRVVEIDWLPSDIPGHRD